MEVTVPAENVQHVSVALTSQCKTSHIGAVNIHGIKNVVNALSHIKVEEMLMPSTTIPMDQLMSGCGKLTISTGDSVVMERRHVILKSTSTVQLPSINGEATPLNYGTLTQLVDVDILNSEKKMFMYSSYLIRSFYHFYLTQNLSYQIYKKGLICIRNIFILYFEKQINFLLLFFDSLLEKIINSKN